MKGRQANRYMLRCNITTKLKTQSLSVIKLKFFQIKYWLKVQLHGKIFAQGDLLKSIERRVKILFFFERNNNYEKQQNKNSASGRRVLH